MTMTMGPYVSFSKEEEISGRSTSLFRSRSVLRRGSTALALVVHPGSIRGVEVSTAAGMFHLGTKWVTKGWCWSMMAYKTKYKWFNHRYLYV
jgi:hypothetical protein